MAPELSRNYDRFARGTIPVATLALFTFLVCYFRSFIFPDIPIVLWGDQLGFFNEGSRIVSGQLPYRDYHQIVPPGTELTYALLIKCFGLYSWIPNLLMAVLAATMTWLITLVARRLIPGVASLLPGLLFTGIILYESLDPTHHWFSTIAVMAAMLTLLDGTSHARVAAAGALCGLAACFTQTKGAMTVAAFIVYLIWTMSRDTAGAGAWMSRCSRKCLLLCGAAAAIFFAANAYFISAAGFTKWVYSIIIYPLRYYPGPDGNNWRALLYDFGWHGGAGKWISYPFVYATVPFVYIILLVVIYRHRHRHPNPHPEEDPNVPWDQLLLVTLTGLGMFLAVASSPSMKRLCAVAAPAMILLVWLLSRPGKNKVKARAKIVLAIVALTFSIEPAIHAQLRWNGYLDLPGGQMAFPDAKLYEEYGWVLTHTHPGDFLFGMPMIYTPLHLRNPAAIDGIETSEYTRPEQIAALIQALDSHPVPLIILRKSGDLLRPTNSPSDHLNPFRAYLVKNYHFIRSFPNGDDAWQKN